jgi:hypothetical protein
MADMKKIKVIATALFAAGVVFASAASAEDKPAGDKAPGSGPNPYSDCGIGAAIFSGTPWAAATSNVIWDLGSTAVTSATSSPQTCSGKKVATAMFIGNTVDKLAEETAAGRGAHLTAMLELFECGASHHDQAIARVRAEMAPVVGSEGYAAQSRLQKASQFYDIVQGAVRTSCSV